MKEAANELISEEQYNVLPPLQQIKTMCLLFERFSPIDSNTAEMKKEIYSLGAKIVFSLRSFLLQSEIVFTIGAISQNGQQLSTTSYAQDEVLRNLNVNLKNRQIELSTSLEKFNDNSLDTYSSLWPQILNAASFDWKTGTKYEQKIYTTSRNKRKWVYRKMEPDTNVWVRYYMRQKQRMLSYYYDKGNFNLTQYNHGWLYEWFQAYIQDPENAEQLQQAFLSNSKTPLAGMMSGSVRENIPGYKGGDYQLANGIWAQAKYGNRRVVTFNSIKVVISSILSDIIKYESNKNYSKEQLAQDLSKTFTDYRTINESYDKIVSTILSQLKLTN